MATNKMKHWKPPCSPYLILNHQTTSAVPPYFLALLSFLALDQLTYTYVCGTQQTDTGNIQTYVRTYIGRYVHM